MAARGSCNVVGCRACERKCRTCKGEMEGGMKGRTKSMREKTYDVAVYCNCTEIREPLLT